ncbi:MAG: chemotaxis protein MotB [Limimaricola sp.]|uniref:flagellar motor protein MotB n=1 Tax=Limimaricola sp. TaxID=2211665 RepID=UPI001DE4E324|nr:flagellar motor protein MotB [Limimaricola sp.]MBI1417269.1 chemotaxis protein MotB [Limimaricola sp.]
MGAHANAPVIIRRKKVIVGGGHHGGAWKVAYADFVTAMMAFFMLMWLLNATTEKQRKGLADYFTPTIALNRVSGGGDQLFAGSSLFAQEALAHDGTGGSQQQIGAGSSSATGQADPAQIAALNRVEDILLGRGGESALSEKALRHIVTRLTDEGLVIEIFDTPDAPLFDGDTDTPTPLLREIATVMARSFALVENGVAVAGHTAARPVVFRENPVWGLSTSRGLALRALLENDGLEPARCRRVTGHADRKLAVRNPMAIRNNRVEVTLLRSDIPPGG